MSHYIEFPNLGWKFNISDTLDLGFISVKWIESPSPNADKLLR